MFDIRHQELHNDYRIIDYVSSGSHSQLNLCVHRQSGKVRLIKFTPRHAHTEKSWRAKLNEISILKELDHPNIIKIKKAYSDNKKLYTVTEYIEGGDLYKFMAENKVIGERNMCKIMVQLLEAVEYCHNLGVAHCHIKPENILLYQSDSMEKQIKLVCWCWAKQLEHPDENHKVHFDPTPYYTAPEIINRGHFNTKIDIWAIGMIFYFMLSQQESPFDSHQDWMILHQIKRVGVRIDPRDFERIEVSEESMDLLRKMLEMRPQRRPTARQCLNHIWIKQYSKPI